jgi:glycosyltransferase involved in cell wall biosynthesis
MKILIVVINNSHGGAEQYLKLIAHHFENHDVSIKFLKKNNSDFWNDTQHFSKHEFYSKSNVNFGVFRFIFRSLFKRSEYDFVFTSHVLTNALVGFVTSLKFIRCRNFIARESTSIFIRYQGLRLFIYKTLYKIGYKNITLLITQTEVMKLQLLSHFPRIAKRTRIEVISNPIDLEKSNAMANEEIDNHYKRNMVVSAGRLIPEKGYDILINAFSHLLKSNPDLKLVIFGEGPERDQLSKLILKLQLSNHVTLHGHILNVYSHFKNAHLCVVSSRIEGFPNVLLQMMSQNVNIVSTECAGGIDEIPGIYSCETNNERNLLDSMKDCLSVNNEANRSIFDTFLKERSMQGFMHKVNQYIED